MHFPICAGCECPCQGSAERATGQVAIDQYGGHSLSVPFQTARPTERGLDSPDFVIRSLNRGPVHGLIPYAEVPFLARFCDPAQGSAPGAARARYLPLTSGPAGLRLEVTSCLVRRVCTGGVGACGNRSRFTNRFIGIRFMARLTVGFPALTHRLCSGDR